MDRVKEYADRYSSNDFSIKKNLNKNKYIGWVKM